MAIDKIDPAMDPAWPVKLNEALQKIWGGVQNTR